MLRQRTSKTPAKAALLWVPIETWVLSIQHFENKLRKFEDLTAEDRCTLKYIIQNILALYWKVARVFENSLRWTPNTKFGAGLKQIYLKKTLFFWQALPALFMFAFIMWCAIVVFKNINRRAHQETLMLRRLTSKIPATFWGSIKD